MLKTSVSKIASDACHSLYKMTREEFEAQKEAHKTAGKSDRAALIDLCASYVTADLLDAETLVEPIINHILSELVLPLQDAAFEEDLKTSTKRVLRLVNVVGTQGLDVASTEAVSLESKILFDKAMASLSELFLSYTKLNDQMSKAAQDMEDASKLVEGGTLTGKELDDACSNLKTIEGRVTSLKSIRDRKMVSIYTALESFYPEIAGSVDTASQKHKPISLHKLEKSSCST
jgi:hypothetical protein